MCVIFCSTTGIWLLFKIEKSVAILFLVKKKRILVSPDGRDKFCELCIILWVVLVRKLLIEKGNQLILLLGKPAKAAKYEIQKLQLVAQHYFIPSFGQCFPFFTFFLLYSHYLQHKLHKVLHLLAQFTAITEFTTT